MAGALENARKAVAAASSEKVRVRCLRGSHVSVGTCLLKQIHSGVAVWKRV